MLLRVLKTLLAMALALAEVGCSALFMSFVHVPTESYSWQVVGHGIDPMNVHRFLSCVPAALVWVGLALLCLSTLARRGSDTGLAGAFTAASIALIPLLGLPVMLWYPEHVGRLYLGAALVGLSAHLAWPLLRSTLEASWAEAVPVLDGPLGRKLCGATAATAVATWLLVLGWMRHRGYWSSLIDLGLFYELFHNAEGRLLYSPTLGHSFLGEHFSPVLVLLWPVLQVLDSPVTLIGVQAVSIGLGGYLLYLWALERIGHLPLALAIALAYLLSPYVQQAALYDFHMDMLEPPMLFGAMLALARRNTWIFVLCCVLLWLTKEDTFLYTSCIALFAMFHERRWVLGAVVLVAGMAQGLFVLLWVLPHLRPEPDGLHFATSVATDGYAFMTRYARWGADPWEVLWSLVSRPHEVAAYVFGGSRLPSVLALLLGFSGLALGARGRLLLIVPVAEMLVSESTEMTGLMFYYGAVATMIAALPAVEGARDLQMRRVGRPRFRWVVGLDPMRMTVTLLAMLAVILATHPRSMLSSHRDYPFFGRLPHHDRAEAMAASLGSGSTVSATGYLAVHVMKGRTVHMFPFGLAQADAVFLDLQRPPWPVDYRVAQAMIHGLVASGEFEVEHAQGGLVLLRRRGDSEESSPRGPDAMRLFLDEVEVEAELTELTRYPDRVERDEKASNGACLSVGGEDARGPGHVIYGPFARFSGGWYVARTRLRWRSDFLIPLVGGLPVVTVDVARKGWGIVATRTLTVADFAGDGFEWRDVELEFEASRTDGPHELRVFYHDLGRLDVDVLKVVRISP